MKLATLTMNPTIDVSFEVDRLGHTHKIRGRAERHDPGGGGINVARVFIRLGGHARCFYMTGGATGTALDAMIDLHLLVRHRIPIRGETRVSTSIFETSTDRQYRFVTEGPEITEEEWNSCLEAVETADCNYLVASGSLPRGVPQDFYRRVAAVAARRGIRFILDSSGPALAKGLEGSNVYLVKPSTSELEGLAGERLDTNEKIVEAARRIIQAGQAENVAVTMGSDGAFLVNAEGALHLPAIKVESFSAVGAGDSFLAGMVHRLALGHPIDDAFQFGVAAGAAAAITSGTDLARPDDIQRLYAATARAVR